MKTIVIVAFLFVLTFSSLVAAQNSSPKSVFQSWNETQLILPIIRGKDAKNKSFDRITATFSGIVRVGRKDFDFLDNRASVTLDFRINKYLSLFTGTMYRRDEIVENVKRYEARFTTGAVISKVWREFSFRDRNMFEHRFRYGRGDTNLYRQRIQISHPLKCGKNELFSPFISEEGYYEITGRQWVQNEFYAGITRKINSKTAIDIAYVRNDSKPANVNGISVNLKLRLR
jgi:hypothetical protein